VNTSQGSDRPAVDVCSNTHCRQWHGEHWQRRLSNASEPQVAQEAISLTSLLAQHFPAWSWKHTSSLAQGTTAFIKIQVCSSSVHDSRHEAPGFHHLVQLDPASTFANSNASIRYVHVTAELISRRYAYWAQAISAKCTWLSTGWMVSAMQ